MTGPRRYGNKEKKPLSEALTHDVTWNLCFLLVSFHAEGL